MEIADDPDLSEEWIILNEQEQDILEVSEIIDDIEQDIIMNNELAANSTDLIITEEVHFGHDTLIASSHSSDLDGVDKEECSCGTSNSCMCGELPPNIEMPSTIRIYVHKRNVKFNRMLSLYLVFTLIAGLALGLGNFLGWLNCSGLQSGYISRQEQQMKFPYALSPKTLEIGCLHFLEQIEVPHDNEYKTSRHPEKNKSLSSLDVVKEYSVLNEDCFFISNLKCCYKKSNVIKYLSKVDTFNSNSLMVNYDEHKPVSNLGKEKPNTAVTGNTINSLFKTNYKDTLDVGIKGYFPNKFSSCIKPSFYYIIMYSCFLYDVSILNNRQKANEQKKVITNNIPFTPMLLDKDESSKVSNRHVNKKLDEMNTHVWEVGLNENDKVQRHETKTEFVSKMRPITSETINFPERIRMHEWFHDHIDHIIETTYDLITLQLRQIEESSMANPKNSLNTTEKVFQLLLKCLMEKLEDIQLFRSSPLFVAHSHLGQKALKHLVRAITEPINKLLKTSTKFLLQDKPLDKKLNELLEKILNSIQKLEYRWVEIKNKWIHLINQEKQKLHENQHGRNIGTTHINENFRKSKVFSYKKKGNRKDSRLKNKVDNHKNYFGEMEKNNKHKNRESTFMSKYYQYDNKNHKYSKDDSKYNQKFKYNKRKVNEYPKRNAYFQTTYKETGSKPQEMRISLNRKADNYLLVSTQ